jgi:hypothetical protein
MEPNTACPPQGASLDRALGAHREKNRSVSRVFNIKPVK